jgi:hypothetical protein
MLEHVETPVGALPIPAPPPRLTWRPAQVLAASERVQLEE